MASKEKFCRDVPLQLGNIESLTDIPIPSVRKSKQNKEEENGETSEPMTMPKSMDELGKTILPASFFEQNIVTAVKENLDPEELERNRTLTKTKTPAQLAAINSISDIPVPDKIKNLLTSSGSEKKAPEPTKKRRHSDIEIKSTEPFNIYSTLPRSLRDTKLVTNVKVEEDTSRPDNKACNNNLQRCPSFVDGAIPSPPADVQPSAVKDVSPAPPNNGPKPSHEQNVAALPTLLPARAMNDPLPLSSLPATSCGLTRPQGFPQVGAKIQTPQMPAAYPTVYRVATAYPVQAVTLSR